MAKRQASYVAKPTEYFANLDGSSQEWRHTPIRETYRKKTE